MHDIDCLLYYQPAGHFSARTLTRSQTLLVRNGSNGCGHTNKPEGKMDDATGLTFAIREVTYAEDVVAIRVVVLFYVGSFLWGVLQLHGHLL